MAMAMAVDIMAAGTTANLAMDIPLGVIQAAAPLRLLQAAANPMGVEVVQAAGILVPLAAPEAQPSPVHPGDHRVGFQLEYHPTDPEISLRLLQTPLFHNHRR
jgi:hypothetical protein